jgi:3-hydroxybutyryl-CoA dehydratase
MLGRPISALRIGESAEASCTVTQTIIDQFVGAVGDANPLHSDPAFAQQTLFGRPIAPGIWTAGFVSGVIGTKLPGPGCIYISQTLSFLKPVFLGDTVTARVEIVELVAERNRARLTTECINQHGETVLRGEAWVKPPKMEMRYESRRPSPLWFVDLPWTLGAAAVQMWGSAGRDMVEWWRTNTPLLT